MRYLGQAKYENGVILLPESLRLAEGTTYAVLEIEGDLWLSPQSSDPQRLEEVARLARQVIEEHRETLEKLAK